MPNGELEELADHLTRDLAQADETQTLAKAEGLLGEAEGPVDRQIALKLLRACRDRSRHAALIKLAQALMQNGQDHPSVRRYLAQGLIEEGQLDEALEVLSKAAVDVQEALGATASHDGAHNVTEPYERLALRIEKAEIGGLLGRAYKQRYINAMPTRAEPRSADAWQAESAYRTAYEAAPGENLWHGINLVAVRLHQHRRLRSDPNERDDVARRVAHDIVRTLEVKESLGSLSVWDQATRAEAFLALERFEEAGKALGAYVANPQLTPFMVASTARQWRELWELSDTPEGRRLLEQLESARPAPRREAEEAPAEDEKRLSSLIEGPSSERPGGGSRPSRAISVLG